MRRLSAAVGVMVALAGMAAAHPHHDTDQQAMLSLGLGRADLALLVLPGTADGPAVARHLDADGNGRLSQDEADAFGAELAAGVSLLVDGLPVRLATAPLQAPPLAEMASGKAGLRLEMSGAFILADTKGHIVTLTVDHDRLGGDWFIQPYFRPDFATRSETAEIERPASGNRLDLTFRLKAAGS